ncbi:MAG: hypothetical protein DRP59_00360 [Spirochaetes bacterium]|nr:MAG: hypothetical protein DRP59_00360 [Spirochaetota bacterium]
MEKAGRSITGVIKFLFLFFLLTNGGFSMAQNRLDPFKLTRTDKKIMKLIDKKFSIDTKTFCNITPDSNYPYWIGSLRRYQAMDEKWITRDPPGSPVIFIVTPSNKIFRSVAEALASIKYVPKDDSDALKVAIMIADVPNEGEVIIDGAEKIEGIPKDVLSKQIILPSVHKDGTRYEVTVFSYSSTETENRFVRGYHSLWKDIITIDGYTYKEKITILWEKRD